MTQSSSHVWAILFGIIILIISVFIMAEEKEVGLVGLLIGLIVLIIGLLSRIEYVRFNAATLSIRQEKKGMGEFTECVRRQIFREFSHWGNTAHALKIMQWIFPAKGTPILFISHAKKRDIEWCDQKDHLKSYNK